MKPSIYEIVPFDSTLGTIVKLSWTGRQQKASTIEIELNDSHTTVYTATYASYKGIHEIPGSNSGTGLVNGNTYRLRARIIDMDDALSDWSDWMTFKCFTTPDLSFDSITEGMTITGSNISLLLNYYQREGEALYKWRIYLLDQSRTEIDKSPESYASSTMTYYFSGLDDKTTYYIRAIGETIDKMPVDTGFIRIVVNYSSPARFVNFEATNNPSYGNIKLTSYVVAIEGEPAWTPRYLADSHGELFAVDLTDGNVVTFNDIKLTKEFTLYTRFFSPTLFTPFLVLGQAGTDSQFVFTWWRTYVEGAWEYQVYLKYNSAGNIYTIWSNPITEIEASGMITMAVQRVDNVFDLFIQSDKQEDPDDILGLGKVGKMRVR